MIDKGKGIEGAVRHILMMLGRNLDDDGLQDTPKRVSRAYRELVLPLDALPPKITLFEAPATSCDQMVVSEGIPFFSLCEHHMLPFYGVCHVGWIPGVKLIGLSKIDRVVNHFMRTLGTQEIITDRIAAHIHERTSASVIVMTVAEHTCKSMRGARSPGKVAVCCMRGDIDKNEFFTHLSLMR